MDLSDEQMLDHVIESTKDLEIGMLVYNAAIGDIGSFYQFDLAYELKKLNVNCRSPLELTYHFGRKMIERKKGGIILMSSASALAGAPYYAHYGATKVYSLNLAEALFYEFQPYQVDVLGVIAGMTNSYNSTNVFTEKIKKKNYLMKPMEVIKETFQQLGKKPSFIPGRPNRIKMFFATRILGRRKLSKIIGEHALSNFLDGKRPTID